MNLLRLSDHSSPYIVIRWGDLVKCQECEVLVNTVSGNERNLRKSGALAKAFNDACNGKLQKALEDQGFPRRFGKDVVVTEAFGDVRCRYIFNVFISACRNRESYRLLEKTISACLQEAYTRNLKSMAFPTLGCGGLHYDPQEICQCFSVAYREFINIHIATDIKVFLYAYDNKTYHELKTGFSRFNYNTLIERSYPGNPVRNNATENSVCNSIEVEFPTFWYSDASSEQCCFGAKRNRLNMRSTIYGEVVDVVMKTWNSEKARGKGRDANGLKHSHIKIRNVFVVENSHLYLDYFNSRVNLRRRVNACHGGRALDLEGNRPSTIYYMNELRNGLDSDLNEFYLFHGTKENTLSSIEQSGIDSRFSGDEVLFGKGAYFAESSTKADQYADDPSDRKYGTSLYMFLSRVLLGNPHICYNPEDFKRPPCVFYTRGCDQGQTCLVHPLCDSVIGLKKAHGTELLFKEFIVYDPKACYPEFLIEYMRV